MAQKGLHAMEQERDLMERQKRLLPGLIIWSASTSYICLYLAAIVAANLITARFGPAASIVNAFFLIALDLTSRDKLHEAWHGHGLVRKMAMLIATGSALSWLLNRNAGRIALASFAAFACANLVDALIYQWLFKKAHIVKINGSNVVSAAVDSVVFPVLAFGWPPMLGIIAGQFAAKTTGGFVWSLILRGKNA